MFFDDRLATVLRNRAEGEASARTQYRQLLDLLGQKQYGRDDSLQAAAWLRLGALGEMIPAKQRANIVHDRGWKFRNPQLAAHLAEDEPEVASAAIARANLSEEEWVTLIPRLPIRARGFLRNRSGLPDGATRLLDQLGVQDRGLPVPAQLDQPATKSVQTEVIGDQNDSRKSEDKPLKPPVVNWPDQSNAAPTSPPSNNPAIDTNGAKSPGTSTSESEKSEIAELVERIAKFRKGRVSGSLPSESSPRLPLDEPTNAPGTKLRSFSFIVDSAGRIEWADQSVAAMVVGKRIFAPRKIGAQAGSNPIASAFTDHQPIVSAALSMEGAPAITGDWIVNAQPRFTRLGGLFHGYVGRMRRAVSITPDGAVGQADRMRQLLHELRTPVNALQGFAEIIQQQLFGPAPNEYRAMAANIAGDAARILAGFDELDRLARLESGMMTLPDGACDLGAILGRMVEQLQAVLAPRMAGFVLEQTELHGVEIALGKDEAEAMIWRVMATLAGCCAAAETLDIQLETRAGKAYVNWQLPEALEDESDPFAAQIDTSTGGVSAGLFGAGFSLRLARAEARSALGDLIIADEWASLQLPLLTEEQRAPSPEHAG